MINNGTTERSAPCKVLLPLRMRFRQVVVQESHISWKNQEQVLARVAVQGGLVQASHRERVWRGHKQGPNETTPKLLHVTVVVLLGAKQGNQGAKPVDDASVVAEGL
jgi:hypothetical protein